jgi:hypothetical protein
MPRSNEERDQTMAVRSKGRKRASAGRKARRKAVVRVQRSLRRIEGELPPTLAQFSRRVRSELGRLEKQIARAETRYRTGWTRLLREASHQLGRFEAEGAARWRRLTTRARGDALKLLRRLEKEIEPARRRSSRRRKAAGAPAELAGTGI